MYNNYSTYKGWRGRFCIHQGGGCGRGALMGVFCVEIRVLVFVHYKVEININSS